MRRWSLGHLTVVGTRPWELVEIAARAGYDAVDPLVGLAEFPGLPVVPLRKGDPDTVRMADALKANAIAFNTADAFMLTADTDTDALARMVDLVAELGARSINALLFGNDLPAATERLVALDGMAAAAGLGLVLEFTALSAVASAEQALEVIAGTGSTRIGLMLDLLHHNYAGGTPESAAAIAGRIGAAQLCDAPARLTFEEYYKTAAEERMAPGEGELPVERYLALLPADMTCAVEVPRRGETDLVARARRMLDAARAMQERIG